MMHFTEVNIFGVYIGPFAPLMLIAWLLCLALFRLFDYVGLPGRVWHPPFFNIAIYIIILCTLVLVAGLF